MDINVRTVEETFNIDTELVYNEAEETIRYQSTVAHVRRKDAHKERHVFRIILYIQVTDGTVNWAKASVEWWAGNEWYTIHKTDCYSTTSPCCQNIEGIGVTNTLPVQFTTDRNRLVDIGWAIVGWNAALQSHWGE